MKRACAGSPMGFVAVINEDGDEVVFESATVGWENRGIAYAYHTHRSTRIPMKKFPTGTSANPTLSFLCECGLRIVIPETATLKELAKRFESKPKS